MTTATITTPALFAFALTLFVIAVAAIVQYVRVTRQERREREELDESGPFSGG